METYRPIVNAEVEPGSLIDFLRHADPVAVAEAILNLPPEWREKCRAAAKARTAPYRVRGTRDMLRRPVGCAEAA